MDSRNRSYEIKVGLFVIFTIALLFLVLFHMGKLKKQDGPTFTVQFSNAGGLSVGAVVRYAGVTVGKVTNIEVRKAQCYYWDTDSSQSIGRVTADGQPLVVDQAFVTIMLTDTSVFPRGLPIFTDRTKVMIATSLMGEQWIQIMPYPGKELAKDQVMIGMPPTSIEDFIAKAEDAIEGLNKAVISVNNVLGDPTVQKDIKLSLHNFQELTGNLKDASANTKVAVKQISERIDQLAVNLNGVIANVDRQVTLAGGNIQGFTASLNRMATGNEGDIRVIVKNLVDTSRSLHTSMAVIEKLVTKQEFSSNIEETLRNIKNTSEEIEGIASDIRAVTSDGQIREDLKIAVHEARQAAEGANKLLKGVNNTLGIEKGSQGIKTDKLFQADATAEWDGKNGKFSPNFNTYLLPGFKHSVKLGMDSIGYDNLWNLQYRAGRGALKPRVGVVRSQVGVGADVDLGKSFGVFVDAYNPRDVNLDLTGRIYLNKDFYLHGGMRDMLDRKRPVFGAGTRF